MTLYFWGIARPSFCKMSPKLCFSDVFSWWNGAHAVLARIPQKRCALPSLPACGIPGPRRAQTRLTPGSPDSSGGCSVSPLYSYGFFLCDTRVAWFSCCLYPLALASIHGSCLTSCSCGVCLLVFCFSSLLLGLLILILKGSCGSASSAYLEWWIFVLFHGSWPSTVTI